MTGLVLFVDDDPALLDGLRRALRAEPFEIACATSGAEALRLLETRPADAVVCDQDMPGMAGTAVLAIIRERWPATRRFMLTGKPALQVAIDAVNHGAITGFFSKPCRPEDLAAAIRTALAEKRQLEEGVERLQQAEVVGQLAGGVAHDLNNLLTVVSGRSHLLLDSSLEPELARRNASVIERASRQAGLLSRRFMDMLRQRKADPELLDLNALVRSLEDLLQALLGRSIALTLDLDADLAPVLGDRGQLEQVVMNLALNAQDAMADGGQIHVRTRNESADVVLAVADTGTGMSPETRRRLFEPFFTTKGPKHGTGLGLPTILLIVERHGGRIDVQTEMGHGTTMTVRLPRAAVAESGA